MIKIGRNKAGEKYSNEELTTLSLDEVKKLIEIEMPDAFKSKKGAAKKTVAKKTAPKKAAPKKAAAKKAKK